MASARQIEANRRNSKKSTGPRSPGGKKRVGRNAYKHGLATTASEKFTREVEQLARKISVRAGGVVAYEAARSVAEASLDLARARRVKICFIDHVAALLEVDPLTPAKPAKVWFQLKQIGLGTKDMRSRRTNIPIAKSEASHHRALNEAMVRALSELMKINRYEVRAASRRCKAIKKITAFS
jgi:hypothetical protein